MDTLQYNNKLGQLNDSVQNILVNSFNKKEEKQHLLQSKGEMLETISGGLMVGSSVINHYTGLGDVALKNVKDIYNNFKTPSVTATETQPAVMEMRDMQSIDTSNLPSTSETNFGSEASSTTNDSVQGTMNYAKSATNKVQDSIMEADPELAENVATNVGADLGTDVGLETAGTALDATGVLAPLGAAIQIGTVIGTAIDGLVDLFKSHHQKEQEPDYSGIAIPQFNPGLS